MNKNISAFIIGLIFSIIGAIASYAFSTVWIFLSLATVNLSMFTMLPLINIAFYALALIGSILCLFKAKIGGRIMVIAAVLSLILFAELCIILKSIHFVLILFWLPSLFILISGNSAIKKYKKNSTQQ